MIMQGYPNRTIGERLFISDRTVKNHISSIYRKTGAANKVQLLNMVRNHPDRGASRCAVQRSCASAPSAGCECDFRPIAGAAFLAYDARCSKRQREGNKVTIVKE